jgi:hypothetical protein
MDWKSKETREFGLLLITGLVVAFVRHGVEEHWKPWRSWEQLFVYWFIHTIGLVLLTGVVLAAIVVSHRFFLGHQRPDYADVTFYILMTVLVGALGVVVLGHWAPSDDDYSLARLLLFS